MSAGSGGCVWAIWNDWSSDSLWRGCWASGRWPTPMSRSTPCAGFVPRPLLPLRTIRAARSPWAGLYARPRHRAHLCASSLRLAQELFGYPGRASSLVVRLDPGADAAGIRRAVAETVGDDFRVRTRDELRASFSTASWPHEKWGHLLHRPAGARHRLVLGGGGVGHADRREAGRHCDAPGAGGRHGTDTGRVPLRRISDMRSGEPPSVSYWVSARASCSSISG